MPVGYKVLVSLLALFVVGGFGAYCLMRGNELVGYITCALALMMVISMWVFPETSRRE